MAVEFTPWYGTAEQMVRCGGDLGCGALLMSGDTAVHSRWHDKVDPQFRLTVTPQAMTGPPAATLAAIAAAENLHQNKRLP